MRWRSFSSGAQLFTISIISTGSGHCRIWLSAKRRRIIIRVVAGDARELAVEHADDFRRLIVDDLLRLLVPERWHRDLAGVMRLARAIGLVQVVEAVDAIGLAFGEPRIVLIGPALHLEAWDGMRDRNRRLELFQRPEDQRAMRPGAAIGDIKVIAPWLRLEAGGAIGGDVMAEDATTNVSPAMSCAL